MMYKFVADTPVFRWLFLRMMRIYYWALGNVRIKAHLVLYWTTLAQLFNVRKELKIGELHDAADYVTGKLITGNSPAENFDQKVVEFGEDVFSELSINVDIRYALVQYLKVKRYYYESLLSNAYTSEIDALENHLNELNISERIDTSKQYFDLYSEFKSQSKKLLKKIKKTQHSLISEATWALIGGWSLSPSSIMACLAIMASVYYFASFVYVHLLFDRFGLDASHLVTVADYAVLASTKAYEMLFPFFLSILVMLDIIYSKAKRWALEAEFEKVASKSKIFVIVIILSIIAMNVNLVVSVFAGDNDRVIEIIYFDIFLVSSCLVGCIPFERIFTNGLPVRILFASFLVFVGGMTQKVNSIVKDIKSSQTATWEYSIDNETLKSDDYSLIAVSSKYFIFFHRETEKTRIIPVDRVSEIMRQAPKT